MKVKKINENKKLDKLMKVKNICENKKLVKFYES
jgi:hypothetical protein